MQVYADPVAHLVWEDIQTTWVNIDKAYEGNNIKCSDVSNVIFPECILKIWHVLKLVFNATFVANCEVSANFNQLNVTKWCMKCYIAEFNTMCMYKLTRLYFWIFQW